MASLSSKTTDLFTIYNWFYTSNGCLGEYNPLTVTKQLVSLHLGVGYDYMRTEMTADTDIRIIWFYCLDTYKLVRHIFTEIRIGFKYTAKTGACYQIYCVSRSFNLFLKTCKSERLKLKVPYLSQNSKYWS